MEKTYKVLRLIISNKNGFVKLKGDKNEKIINQFFYGDGDSPNLGFKRVCDEL